jgi:precorrin-6A synthase
MLDGQCSFNNLLDEELDIFWGAYLGMEEEILLSGKLNEIASRIEEVRHERRQRNGWIMDTYFLTRPRKATQAESSRAHTSCDQND